MVQPGIEPGTSRVWGERDNHYTTEPWMVLTLYYLALYFSRLQKLFILYADRAYTENERPPWLCVLRLPVMKNINAVK